MNVWTARISTKDPDRYDITRKSGNPIFAPSWALLGPLLSNRRAGHEQTEEEWRAYAAGYLKEMARSYKINRPEWDLLLARERIVLVCYCTNPLRCHRRVLARILASLGAVDCGELSAP